jgi:uncharacterized protein YjaG (DUF416 family)
MKSVSFESLSLDEGLDLLQSRVARLSRPKLAAFFGSIGAAMLPIYLRFSASNHWGDVAVLRAALDTAFVYATGKSDFLCDSERMLDSIAEITPNEDQFETPESTFAMDAVICVDAALRACDPGQSIEPAWVEFAVDPAITTLCEQQTGYLDLGSSPEEDVWRAQALRNPALKGAFEAVSEMVDLLSLLESTITQEILETLKQLATRLVPTRYVSV